MQNVFKLPPLLDHHSETVKQSTVPALSWLRSIGQQVVIERRLGEQLSASALVELSLTANIAIPGSELLKEEGQYVRHVGAIIAPHFRDAPHEVRFDSLVVRRVEVKEYNEDRRGLLPARKYVFTSMVEVQADEGAHSGVM